MKRELINWIRLDILLTVIATLYYLVLRIIQSNCLINAIFGIQCPTYGMTRAILCLLNGDIDGYFYFHPFALPTVIIVYFSLHVDSGNTKKLLNIFTIILAVIIMVRYIINYI